MMYGLALILTVQVSATSLPQIDLAGPYLGEKPPGMEPVLFAPGVVSVPGRLDRVASFTADGREFFFSTYFAGWSDPKIWHMKEVDGTWTDPVLASFAQNPYSTEQFISQDGFAIFFVDLQPPYEQLNTDIWRSDRTEDGWSLPQPVGNAVNSSAQEWHPCVTARGTLFFTSLRDGGYGETDIYQSELINGEHPQANNLGAPINTEYHEWDPYVSPSEDYLIFKSDRPGGYGDMDMYISFRGPGGSWLEPVNLGPPFNTEYHDDSGDVSADGKYFFFSRKIGEEMDMYWVSARVLEQYRPGSE